MESSRPIRILHIVGGMNRGGAETWLMHVLRHIDRERFHMDFLVHTTQPCAYDDEIRALGSDIIPCLDPHRPLLYARNFWRILREHGPYDIVHSHVHLYSGYTLMLAHLANVPIRIAHSHSDTSTVQAEAGAPRCIYQSLMKQWITRYATKGIAASRNAAGALFGVLWEADPRWQIIYYGIDLAPFRATVDPATVRAELGIPKDAFVIGHVGRFVEVKNHTFLVDIAAEVMKREPKTWLLLVGDGPLRPAIEEKVASLGLTDRVIFTGVRSDVPRLMLGAMDVFLMPSHYEGLPVAGLEAQAAGLPMVLSDAIAAEVEVVLGLVSWASLSGEPPIWGERILLAREAAISQPEAFATLERSLFNVEKGMLILESLYEGRSW